MESHLQSLFTETVGTLEIEGLVTTDHFKLFLLAHRPSLKDPLPSLVELLQILEPHCQLKFVNEAVVQSLLEKLIIELDVGPVRVAVGIFAQQGEPGRLTLRVKPFTGAPSVDFKENETANLTNLHLFDSIAAGEHIGKIVNPTPGTPGIDISGNSVAATPGDAVQFHHDGSLCLEVNESKTGKNIIALQEGFLAGENGYYSVRSTFVVQHDLDFRFGSLEVRGRVFIGQDVLPGFSIKARHGITVMGSVRGGSLISSEGDITVGGYIYGGAGSKILAGGSLRAGALQEVDTEILKDIEVEREVLNSTLRCAGTVYIRKGSVVGGTTMATRGVLARAIGSEAGTRTVINLCKEIEASMRYARLLVDLELQDEELQRLDSALGPLALNPELIEQLDSSLRGKYRSKYLQRFAAVDKRDRLREQQRSMIQSAADCRCLFVSFREKLFPGVEIVVGGQTEIISAAVEGPATLEFQFPQRKFILGAFRDPDET